MAIQLRRRRLLRWRVIGPALLLGIAAIHAATYSDQAEIAQYVGILFLVNAATALSLAIAMAIGGRWSWPGAGLFSAVTIALYVTARTTGLPGYHEDDWLDLPFGLLSLIVETAVIVAYGRLLVLRTRPGSEPAPHADRVEPEVALLGRSPRVVEQRRR